MVVSHIRECNLLGRSVFDLYLKSNHFSHIAKAATPAAVGGTLVLRPCGLIAEQVTKGGKTLLVHPMIVRGKLPGETVTPPIKAVAPGAQLLEQVIEPLEEERGVDLLRPSIANHTRESPPIQEPPQPIEPRAPPPSL